MTVSLPDQILLAPPSSDGAHECKLPRVEDTGYRNTSQKFRLGEGRKDYNRQYFEVYGARLAAMRPLVVAEARRRFGQDIQVKTLSDLREDDDEVTTSQQEELILLVGTVFKQQERKPSILKELSEPSEDGELEVEPAHTKYTADTDTLVLEDETMRVRLEDTCGKMKVGDLVNGVVAGVWGREAQGGKFSVRDVVYSGLRGAKSEVVEEQVSLCLVSGLELGGEGAEHLPAAQLAVDWIVGSTGAPGEQEEVARLGRLVIAGDSLSQATRDRGAQTKALYLTVGSAAGSIAAVRQLDDLLVQAASSLATDIMPGPSDPATCVLPQQPLHRLMFTQAGRLPTLQSVTNPYSLAMAGRTVIVTSGQAVADILRNSELPGPLEAMERCLVWGHLAPTAPDTLGLFPYSGTDPHVLTELPDVFVAGNQPEFLSKKVEMGGHTVLLVAVPRFSHTRSLVTLDMRTLTCQQVSFDFNLN